MSSEHRSALRGGRRLRFGRQSLEICLVALFALTVAIITFQHRIFGRDIVVSGETAAEYMYSGYADNAEGGVSRFERSGQPLAWTCDIKTGARALYCGNDIIFDRNGRTRGVDMRSLESFSLTFEYYGPSPTLRLHLKNDDPRYSRPGDRATAKPNKVEFSVRQGRQTLEFRPQELSVADWWLTGQTFGPEVGRTQLDNIVSVDVSTGSDPRVGEHRIAIKSLTFRRSSISPDQLYLSIMAIWSVLIGGYMLLRMRWAERDALEKEQAQAEARAALASAASAAERANQAKTDFLANVSHELRTPLNAVVGYAQILENSALEGEDLRAVQTIHQCGEHVLSLISDLLDLSKVEAGKMEVHNTPFDLHAAINTVVAMLEVRAQEKGIAFVCDLPADLPVGVNADEKKLRQILLNLLSNAVKFTDDGAVTLRVASLEQDDDQATLRFEVIDTGAGIDEGDVSRLFRPFEQVGDGHKQDGGTGLGLSITQSLAGLMGSTIEVESRLGQGSRFWFDLVLPLAALDADVDIQSETGKSPAIDQAGRPPRVLAAEDNPVNQHILRAMLEPAGVELQIVANGREAVEAVQADEFGLVLMDAQMPVMNGVEAAREIRAWEAKEGRRRTPIIALSGDVMAHHLAQYRAAGMDGHVEKPIRIEDLFAAIEVAIGAPEDQLADAG